ncbi:hypothetical protein FB45DRAFT_1036711 [Roridomyces roridus]|uniref:phosphoglycerate mutase (2,3-diphosphoglycerate-independent) n=1 Tax=Roridomyces roridus TaxID=1738132 RepID=A0AAD7B7R6_9AGAR|nr:hypothetical protein FB45DRAFT_1036711 [Roridomyces roridus]
MEAKCSVVLPASPHSITRLLTSNHCALSDLESRIAKAHIHDLESPLAWGQNIIALSHQRVADLERSFEAHKAVISPIGRLPNELLAEIFSHAARRTFFWKDISEAGGRLTSKAPWVLTHVSRGWAAVALEYRTLWSRIFVDLDLINVKARGVISILKLFLERSGKVPLTVKIFYEGYQLETHPALHAVLGHVERWKHVDMYVRWPLLLSTAAAMRDHLSVLTTLRVVSFARTPMDARDLSDTFASAANLTALQTYFRVSDIFHSPFQFPWHQLTRLSTTFSSIAEALTNIEQLSSVVELRVELPYDESPAPVWNCITLSRLRVLEMVLRNMPMVSLDPPSYLLDFLSAPVLGRLGIQRSADQIAVSRFITRSGCGPSLKIFHFIHSVTPTSVLPILQKLPHLEDVKFGDFKGALLAKSAVAGVVDLLLLHWRAVRTAPDAHLSVTLIDSQPTPFTLTPFLNPNADFDICVVADLRVVLSPGQLEIPLRRLAKLLIESFQTCCVYVHCIGDGRDTAPRSAAGYCQDLLDFMAKEKYGALATVVGRYYAMDRDKRWERVKVAVDGLVGGVGEENTDAVAAIKQSYENDVTDEFMKPVIVNGDEGRIKDDDTLFFFNYRSDRMREISAVFGLPDKPMEVTIPKNVHITTMSRYNSEYPFAVAFPPQAMTNVLAEWLAAKGRISPTEKYAHVTFFFNGGVEAQFMDEERHMIASPKVATYDLQPEMDVQSIADKVAEVAKAHTHD